MAINDGKGINGVPDRGYSLYVVSVVMVIVAGLFVIGRIAVRLAKNKLDWDDRTIVAALVRNTLLKLSWFEARCRGH
jgi:hypothetical protein